MQSGEAVHHGWMSRQNYKNECTFNITSHYFLMMAKGTKHNVTVVIPGK